MDNLTKSQVFSYASELRKMLKSDAFLYAVKCLQTQYTNDFFSTGPTDTQQREVAYRQNRALDDLLSSMETIVFVAENDNQET